MNLKHHAALALLGFSICSATQAGALAYPTSLGPQAPLPEDLQGVHTLHLAQLEWSEYSGRKTRIGVSEVENTSSMSSYSASNGYGQTININFAMEQVPVHGIEAMVMDAMAKTGRFQVLERAELDTVIAEQDLGASGRVLQPSAAKVGKIVGAEYLVKVVITDYQPNAKGSNVGLGGLAALAGRNAGLLGGVGISSKTGTVGLNFRLIDAQSSEMVFSKQVNREIKESGLTFGGAGIGGGGAFGGFMSQYAKTPIGQAVMAAVNEGIYELVKQIGSQPARGSVAQVDGDTLFVSLGKTQTIPGERFKVIRPGKAIINPETGEELGSIDSDVGVIEIVQVMDKMSLGRSVDGTAPQIADRIIAMTPPAPLEFGVLTPELEKKPKKKRTKQA